jgi:hypothetical protein
MLTAFQIQERNQWHNVLTGDENWFCFECLRDRLWVSSPENARDFPGRTVASKKHMLTVSWNPDGFHVVMILPRGTSFNTTWFTDRNLVSLRDQFFPGGRRPDQKTLMVHIENASPVLHR